MITCAAQQNTLHVELATASINPLSKLWQQELSGLLEQLESLPDTIRCVCLRFDRDTVLADYELPHLMTLTPAQASDCMTMLASYQHLLRRLETLGKPVIFLLDGHLSGAALGLALAGQRRYALADTRYSLPQITLGIMPCSSEVTRLGRLAGFQAALPLLLEGQSFDNQTALQLGLIHASAADAEALGALMEQDLASATDPRQPWDMPDWRLPGGAPESGANLRLLQMAPAILRARTGGHSPAAEALLCALTEGLQLDYANALLIERRYFCQTVTHPYAKQLMRLSQLSCDITGTTAQQLHLDLDSCYTTSCQSLRAEGVSEALLRNAARGAGLPVPPAGASILVPPRTSASAYDAETVAARLLMPLAALASQYVAAGKLTADAADQVSVQRFGFPAHLGGAYSFVLSKQA